MIDTLFSDLQECAGMGARAFRTRRQLRRDARKDLPNAYAPTPRDVLVRLLCCLVLIASLGVILTGCGGGNEPADDIPAQCKGLSDRATATCMGIADSMNAYAHPCTAPMNDAMWGFWQRMEECGIPRESVIALKIPIENR